ncbi:MAG: phage tail protein [Lachnospiraceae bacterium]|nr:phage tail protein [Lachnospiraceae bacterium]
MIKIFNSNDKNFSSNGNIAISPLKCLEVKKKSLNGWYLEVEVPIEYKDYIEKDKLVVVKAKSKLSPQAFRINDNIEYSTRKISFTADHVMFDSKNYFLLDVRPTNMNALNSLIYINERTDSTSPFTIRESNVEGINTSYFIRKSLFEAWTVIEEKFNGVFDADNFDISFNISTGTDRGEVVCYGKNAQNVKIFEDWSEVCTKLYPVGKDGLLLPEKYLVSNKQYSQPYTRTVSFETSLEEEDQTEENLTAELRTNGENYLNEHKEPKVSYEVKSDINQLCEIGDTIHVKHPLINLITNVIEYEYDIILGKVKTLTFGNYARDVKAKFDNIKSSINTLKEVVNTQSTIISEQTDLINSLNKNGYVYIDDNEILILDSLPKENAQNIWRFGLGGIGFSTHGYEGPFETAITQDGKINANFIQVGQMSTSRIQGLDELILEINKIVNLTKDVESINYLFIENAMQGQLQELTIQGNINLIYPEKNLYPSNNLYPIDTYLIVDTARTLTQNAKRYHLPFNFLNSNEKFKYIKGKSYLIHSDESVEELSDVDIQLFEGDNYLYLESFPNQILPEEYTQVDYIENTGKQYIDTGIHGNLNTEIITKVTNNNYSGQLFGDITNNSKAISCNFSFNSSLISRFGNKESSSILGNYVSSNNVFTLKENKEGIYINGSKVQEFNATDTFITENTLLLFNRNSSSGSQQNTWKGKLYYFKIYDNNSLVRDFIPCYRNSDNEVGLYDLVNNVFYTNQGTGAFTYGSTYDIDFTAKYVVKSKYTDVFSTKAEMSSAINLTNQTIDLKLEKKTDKDNIIAQINMSTEKDSQGSYIGISADKINLQGKKIDLTSEEIEIDSTNFSVDKDGNMKCSNGEFIGKILGGTIHLDKRANEGGLGVLQIDSLLTNGAISGISYLNGDFWRMYSQTGTGQINATVWDNSAFFSVTGNITCESLTQTSKKEKKKNFEKLTNAKEILNSVDIYKYNFKKDNNKAKKLIGFVIGDGFNYSEEITSTDNDGANVYSMVSVLWQVVKEQQEEIKELKEMIKYGI